MNSQNYTIRKARLEDAPLLANAEREITRIPGRLASRPEEIKEENVREKISSLSANSSGIYLVIEKNGLPVGHGFLDPHKLANTSHVVILSLAIHEGYQGIGLGKMLMQKLIEWAKAQPQIEKIELQVRSSNKNGIHLYTNLGFIEEGRKTKRLKYGEHDYQDDVYMALWVGN